MKIYLYFLLLTLSIVSFAQDKPVIEITRANSKITLDGKLDEEAWFTAQKVSGFHKNFPIDSGLATHQTEVMMKYDLSGIYIGVVCFDENPKKSIIQSLKRDFLLNNTDAFTVSIDPFGDLTNGFSFSISPYNVQREGLISNGGSWGATTSWDNKWFSETQILDDRWIAEIFIPFKTIRYSNNLKTWKINFTRTDYKINEKTSWAHIPINFGLETINFSGDLVWDENPPKAGTNVSLIPYATTGVSVQYENNDGDLSHLSNVGADAKVGLTQSLNLDITINPDFSNVEVDDQILNISRFSIALPEKRQFFLENSDLFGDFGFRNIRPFFSRNIGLKLDTSISQMVQVPILSGMRMSGKINKNWRVGAMNVIEMDSSAFMLSSSEPGLHNDFISNNDYGYKSYNIGVVQRQTGVNSNVGLIFVNETPFSESGDINSVAGIDYNWTSKDNKYKAKIFSHQSFTEGVNQSAWSQQANATFFMRNTKKYFVMWNHEYVGENYNAVNGFVPRVGIWRLEPYATYSIFPDSKYIQSHKMGAYWNYYTDLNYKRLDDFRKVNINTKFLNTSETDFGVVRNYIGLNQSFDPTFQGDTSYAAGENFINYFVTAGYWSNITKMFSFKLNVDYGQYFAEEGKKFGTNLELYYRYQPYFLFSVIFNNNYIALPGFKQTNLTRLGPKLELTLTNNLFFNYYLQYNSVNETLSNNVRLQWRFKPLSDLFVVYTDNYDATSDFGGNNAIINIQEKQNRALIFKFVYWLNL